MHVCMYSSGDRVLRTLVLNVAARFASLSTQKYFDFCRQFIPIGQTIDIPPNTPPVTKKKQLSSGSVSRCDLFRSTPISKLDTGHIAVNSKLY